MMSEVAAGDVFLCFICNIRRSHTALQPYFIENILYGAKRNGITHGFQLFLNTSVAVVSPQES